MLLTIRNLTSNPINISDNPPTPSSVRLKGVYAPRILEHGSVLHPSIDLTTWLPKAHANELILQQRTPSTDGLESTENEWHIHPESFKIRFSMALTASWQVVDVPEGCPWWIVTSRITRKHHKLLILSHRNLGSFLSDLPDQLPLSSVVLPGTHDTMAFHGWPISQCQSPSTPLSNQLLGGIRIIDIRLAVIPPPRPGSSIVNNEQRLIAYHGLWPQQTPFLAILNEVQAFLTSPTGSKETIVMSIKQEDFATTPAHFFSQFVHQTIMEGPGGWAESVTGGSRLATANKGIWFLENRIPTLGEVRGKVVLFSRFGGHGDGWEGGLEGIGIHPTNWPDSARDGFEWELKGTRVRTHDWYAIPSFFSIPEKIHRATANLIPPDHPSPPLLPITYFSAASFPFAFPPTVAKGFGWPKWGLGVEGVNSLLGKWLLDQLGGLSDSKGKHSARKEESVGQITGEEPRIRGWTFLDYYTEPEGGALIPLLVECNFRGRKKGKEGW